MYCIYGLELDPRLYIIRLDLKAQDDVCWKEKIWFWLSITFVDKEEFNGYVSEEISKKIRKAELYVYIFSYWFIMLLLAVLYISR